MDVVAGTWTVLTWNIQGNKRTDLGRLAEVISDATADVVALQEVRRPQASQLSDRLAVNHIWAEKHHLCRPVFPGRAEGQALLTPHRMTATGDVQVSDESSMRSYRRRIVQWATVTRSDGSLCRIYNVHLSPHDLVAERLAEATRISDIVDSHGDTAPVVIAGDLNDAGEPQIVVALPGKEALGTTATNPAAAPVQTLDHVLVPTTATDVSVSTPVGGHDWAVLSDHVPVTVRFTLDWPASG